MSTSLATCHRPSAPPRRWAGVLLAAFLQFEFCRIDMSTSPPTFTATGKNFYVRSDVILGFEPFFRHQGDDCVKIIIKGGFTRFVHGTRGETVDIINRGLRPR